MIFDITSLIIGIGISLLVFLIIFSIRKKKKGKTSLPMLKGYITSAHKNLADANNNLIKLYEVFNQIDNERA